EARRRGPQLPAFAAGVSRRRSGPTPFTAGFEPALGPSLQGDCSMSLYGMQKFLYHLYRDARVQQRHPTDRAALLDEYALTDEERGAIEAGDIGLIYVLGANGQLLMHFAAFLEMPWPDYIQSMRDGIAKHGPVRDGIYAMTTDMDTKVAGV